MRVSVDASRCRGHGVCWAATSEVFDLNDDGYSEVLLPDVPPHLEDAVRQAERQCPERAISTT